MSSPRLYFIWLICKYVSYLWFEWFSFSFEWNHCTGSCFLCSHFFLFWHDFQVESSQILMNQRLISRVGWSTFLIKYDFSYLAFSSLSNDFDGQTPRQETDVNDLNKSLSFLFKYLLFIFHELRWRCLRILWLFLSLKQSNHRETRKIWNDSQSSSVEESSSLRSISTSNYILSSLLFIESVFETSPVFCLSSLPFLFSF